MTYKNTPFQISETLRVTLESKIAGQTVVVERRGNNKYITVTISQNEVGSMRSTRYDCAKMNAQEMTDKFNELCETHNGKGWRISQIDCGSYDD